MNKVSWRTTPTGVVEVSTDEKTYAVPTIRENGYERAEYNRALRFLPVVRQFCGTLPASWVIGIIFAERSPFNAVSDHGAVGVMQILPATAQVEHEQLKDIRTNVRAGCKFLRSLRNFHHDDLVAVASMYNAGMTNAGFPHESVKSPFGYAEAPGYIIRVISAANEFALRGEVREVRLAP